MDNSTQTLKGAVEKPYIKFTLTIESNSLGSIVDLFDQTRIHEGAVSETYAHETPESLMEEAKPEPEPAPASQSVPAVQPEPAKTTETQITMEQLKHLAVQVSDRYGSKKVVGDAIRQHFGCRMPDLKPEQYEQAHKILEDLNNA